MHKKKLALLILIISIFFSGCAAADDAASIYNKALEKTEQVQRYNEVSSFEIVLKNNKGEYRIETYQDIITDRSLGISAGTVRVQNSKGTSEFEIYDRRGDMFIRKAGTENYINSPRRTRFVPDIREKCIEVLVEAVEEIKDKETLDEKVSFERKENTKEVVIKSRIQCKKIEKTMFEIVKESIVSEEAKKEVAEETVEKMKKAVKDLGENISEEEIRKVVDQQIEEIDKEFRAIIEDYKCTNLVFTTTINNEGYISEENILFEGREKDGRGTIEIRINYFFKGPSSAPIKFPKLTDEK